MKKINDIFYSIQGEGAWTGTPIIFIRFSGCNLKCDFCDTLHEEGKMMSDEEILKQISSYSCSRICLTGGEPSLQIDQAFIDKLKDAGYTLHIETNGTRTLPKGIDWVTVSPKYKKMILKEADELKIVYLGQDLSEWDNWPAKTRFLQPCSGKNTSEVIDYIKLHPEWRLSLQVHKMINIK